MLLLFVTIQCIYIKKSVRERFKRGFKIKYKTSGRERDVLWKKGTWEKTWECKKKLNTNVTAVQRWSRKLGEQLGENRARICASEWKGLVYCLWCWDKDKIKRKMSQLHKKANSGIFRPQIFCWIFFNETHLIKANIPLRLTISDLTFHVRYFCSEKNLFLKPTLKIHGFNFEKELSCGEEGKLGEEPHTPLCPCYSWLIHFSEHGIHS